MATKKPAAAKATDKKAAKKADYSTMSAAELAKALQEKQQELLAGMQSHRSGELVNPRVLAANRKEIARIMTAINANKESK